MSQMILYDHITPYIPEMNQAKAELIMRYWRAFWERPREFEGTGLSEIITDWLELETPKYEYDECGALVRKRK